jgi:hypothetical protein
VAVIVAPDTIAEPVVILALNNGACPVSVLPGAVVIVPLAALPG